VVRNKSLGGEALSELESLARQSFRRHAPLGSAADAVHAAVVESIESGWFPAGMRLGEEYLAELFSVSRTPVREALMRLEVEHFAERDRHRGLVVGYFSAAQIVELYVVREALDGVAGRLAAIHAQSLDIGQLSQINRSMRQAAARADYGQMATLNLEFHMLLAQASRNQMLQRFTEQIHRWVRRFSTTTFAYPDRADEAIEEHESLIAAISARNPELAERTARDHMHRAMEVRIQQEVNPSETSLDPGA